MKKGIEIWRDAMGIPHVEAENLSAMYWGNGYVHATDRGMQMLLMRILGQGRASEILDASDDTLKVDMFFRRMNWSGNVKEQVAELGKERGEYLEAYCAGVNAAFSKKTPWEFKLLGYNPEEWVPENSIMITRMVGYLTLVQSQAEMERLLVELVQGDVSREKLEELDKASKTKVAMQGIDKLRKKMIARGRQSDSVQTIKEIRRRGNNHPDSIRACDGISP